MKFQQLTGPVMAKGVEDTAFYVYNRLISLNEVGGDPEEFGISLEAFSRAQRGTAQTLAPYDADSFRPMTPSAARMGVRASTRFPRSRRSGAPPCRAGNRFNEANKTLVNGEPVPDRNDEYLFYQTLIGAWPAGSA